MYAYAIQLDLYSCNVDTLGMGESVLISEVVVYKIRMYKIRMYTTRMFGIAKKMCPVY